MKKISFTIFLLLLFVSSVQCANTNQQAIQKLEDDINSGKKTALEALNDMVMNKNNSKPVSSKNSSDNNPRTFMLNITGKYLEVCENPKNTQVQKECLIYLSGVRDTIVMTTDIIAYSPNVPKNISNNELQSIFIKYTKKFDEFVKNSETSLTMWEAWANKFGLNNETIRFNSASDYLKYCEDPEKRHILDRCYTYLAAIIEASLSYGATYSNAIHPNIPQGSNIIDIKAKVIEHMKGSSDEKLSLNASMYIIAVLVVIYGDKNAKQDNIKK